MPREINANSFDDEVINSDKALVEFFSPECIPCKNAEQSLIEAEKELGDEVKVVKVNVYESPDKACQFSIMSVPTVIGFSKGRILDSLKGVRHSSEYIKLFKE